jgi:hypothetical protein
MTFSFFHLLDPFYCYYYYYYHEKDVTNDRKNASSICYLGGTKTLSVIPCKRQDCSITWTPGAWQYISAKDIWGVTLVGKYNTYGGGGYIMAMMYVAIST